MIIGAITTKFNGGPHAPPPLLHDLRFKKSPCQIGKVELLILFVTIGFTLQKINEDNSDHLDNCCAPICL